MMYLFVAIVIGVLIAVHELGHFVAARLSGMRVDSFSIGFGPALFSLKGKQTVFRVGMVPLGGYVKIAGLNPHDGTPDDDPSAYPNRPVWQRFVVLLAGPMMNYVLAYLLLVVILVAGHPELIDQPILDQILPMSAAANAGLKPGDRVVSVNGAALDSWRGLVTVIQKSNGDVLRFVIQRDAQQLQLDVKPDLEDGIPRLGVGAPKRLVTTPLPEAIPRAFKQSVMQSLGVFVAIYLLIKREPGIGVEGPPGILQDLAESASAGWAVFGQKVVDLSLALFMFNLLPIAALDGGRLLFLLIGVIRRKPVSTQVETWIHGLGFLGLLVVFVVVSFSDCNRFLDRVRRSSSRAPAAAPVLLGDAGTADGG